MNCSQIATVALRAGELLLRHNAEIYRVQETINRICGAYGAVSSAFVLTNGIFVSVDLDGELVTLTRSIRPHFTDLAVVEAVNDFSRSCADSPPQPEDALKLLDAIENKKRRPEYLMFPARIICAATITAMFGAGLYECLSAAVIYVFVYFIAYFVRRMGLFPFLEYFVSGVVAGLIGVFTSHILNVDISLPMICALYPLLPGISITNGIRDFLNGDVFSGLARIAEVVILLLVLSVGVVFAFFWTRGA